MRMRRKKEVIKKIILIMTITSKKSLTNTRPKTSPKKKKNF